MHSSALFKSGTFSIVICRCKGLLVTFRVSAEWRSPGFTSECSSRRLLGIMRYGIRTITTPRLNNVLKCEAYSPSFYFSHWITFNSDSVLTLLSFNVRRTISLPPLATFIVEVLKFSAWVLLCGCGCICVGLRVNLYTAEYPVASLTSALHNDLLLQVRCSSRFYLPLWEGC